MPGSALDDSLPDLWRRLFRTALIDWVHDFLFQTDPATLASILLAPLQATNSIAMSVAASQLESGAGHVPRVEMLTTWLLLPAFSVGAVSVGIVVEGDVRGGPWRLVRYVRDDDTGETVCICDDGAVVEAEMLRYASPSASTRAYFQFARPALLAMRAARGAPSVDARALRAALEHSMVLAETRACAVCGAAPAAAAACGCKFSFARAQHPLDFRHTAANTLPLIGDFRGAGPTTTYRAGRADSESRIETHVVTTSGAPGGTTDRMLTWAVQRCLANATANPRALAVPSPAPRSPADSGQLMAELFLRADDIAVDPAAAAAAVPPPDPGPLALPAHPVKVQPQHVRVQPPRPPQIAPVTPFAVVPGVPVVPGVCAVASGPLANGVPVGGQTLLLAGGLPGAAGFARVPQKRAWIAIAPAPLAAGPAADVGGAGGGGGGGAPEVQYSSAERRKIMKREAAARSNAKRREVVALQKSIDKERAKAAALRLREQSLQEENSRLRLHFRDG